MNARTALAAVLLPVAAAVGVTALGWALLSRALESTLSDLGVMDEDALELLGDPWGPGTPSGHPGGVVPA